MVEVQNALSSLMTAGLPVYLGAWRPTTPEQVPPDQYVVYSAKLTESFAYDDKVKEHQYEIYMELWSKSDPTAMIESIRSLMYTAGFGLDEESDKGYNQPSYDFHTKNFNMSWIWTYTKEVDYGS